MARDDIVTSNVLKKKLTIFPDFCICLLNNAIKKSTKIKDTLFGFATTAWSTNNYYRMVDPA